LLSVSCAAASEASLPAPQRLPTTFHRGSEPAERCPLEAGGDQGCGDTAPLVALGFQHVCALARGGELRCWGANAQGQLGDGTRQDRSRPVRVNGVDDAVGVFASWSSTCAVRRDRSLWCWGAFPANSPTPTRIAGVAAVKQIAMGYGHICVSTLEGKVSCWGSNDHGQLGDGSTTNRDQPFTVPGITDAKMVAVGDPRSCALSASGAVVCWGADGIVDKAPWLTPTPVEGLPPMRTIQMADDQACGLTRNGSVYCWGRYEAHGVAESSDPIKVHAWGDVRSLAVGFQHRCALGGDGAVSCMGYGEHGVLGSPALRVDSPVGVSLFDGSIGPRVESIYAGARNTCALDDTRSLRCFGDNEHGQLGIGETATIPNPNEVPDTDGAVEALVLFDGGCALRKDGKVVCWGAGGKQPALGAEWQPGWHRAEVVQRINHAKRLLYGGQMGQACIDDGRGDLRCFRHGPHMAPSGRPSTFAPRRLQGLRDVVDTTQNAGIGYEIAVTAQGKVIVFGEEKEITAGDETAVGLQTREIQGLGPVKEIAASWGAGCALRRDGTAVCWKNDYPFGEGRDGPIKPKVVQVDGLRDGVSLGVGSRFCALRRDHTVLCWRAKVEHDTLAIEAPAAFGKVTAFNRSGDCFGTERGLVCDRESGAVSYPGQILAVDGSANTCFVTKGNKVMCQGTNRTRALGSPDRDLSFDPVLVKGLDP
jgi:alpha-tubulin suppressor-like RCC1 family protein